MGIISETTKWRIYKYLMMEAVMQTVPYKEAWFYWLGYGKLNQN